MPIADSFQAGYARTATDKKVLGVNLEPETVRSSDLGCSKCAGFKPIPADSLIVTPAAQPSTGVREPMPTGVLIVVHVPAGTYCQAFA